MNKIKLLLALMALALPGMAKAERIPTYVSVATWTFGGTGTKAYAFQNVSSTRNVTVQKIAVYPVDSGTITSGPANIYVYASTQIVHGGTSQVSAGAYDTPNWSQPSWIRASTGPVGVQYEGGATYQLPMAVLGVNPDETGTPLQNIVDNGLDITSVEEMGFKLPMGTNRGIVLEQKQFGATDWTAGKVLVRITYILK